MKIFDSFQIQRFHTQHRVKFFLSVWVLIVHFSSLFCLAQERAANHRTEILSTSEVKNVSMNFQAGQSSSDLWRQADDLCGTGWVAMRWIPPQSLELPGVVECALRIEEGKTLTGRTVVLIRGLDLPSTRDPEHIQAAYACQNYASHFTALTFSSVDQETSGQHEASPLFSVACGLLAPLEHLSAEMHSLLSSFLPFSDQAHFFSTSKQVHHRLFNIGYACQGSFFPGLISLQGWNHILEKSNSFREPIQKLDFSERSNRKMKWTELLQIPESYLDLAQVTELDLAGQPIEVADIETLIHVFKKLPQLTRLNLKGTFVRVAQDGDKMEEFAQALLQLQQLRYLNLSHCEIGSENVSTLASLLRGLPQLQEVWLMDNPIKKGDVNTVFQNIRLPELKWIFVGQDYKQLPSL